MSFTNVLKYGLVSQGGEIIQRPQVCIYGNGTNFIRSDNDFNFGAATNKSYTIAGWCQSTQLGGVAPNLYTEFFVMLGTATWRSFFRFYQTIGTTQSHYHFNVAAGKYFFINYRDWETDRKSVV